MRWNCQVFINIKKYKIMFKVRKYYLGMAIYNFSFKQVHKYTRLRKQKLNYFGCTNKYLLEIW